MYDVAIIGAGIIGTSIARELSKYNLKTIIIEKENDVADGTTKANSAIVHAGYDAKPGSKKAKFNVIGNKMYEELCKELDVPFKRKGSFVLGFTKEDMNTLEELKKRGEINGVEGLEILDREEVLKIEPNLNKNIEGALYAKTAGIVGPFELAIALAENAMDNGVELLLNSKVTSIKKEDKSYKIYINENMKEIESTIVINCAGIHGDTINNMVCPEDFKITPRRGQYFVLDKSAGKMIDTVIFQCPSELGKGVLVTPTVHGNLLVGPDAEDINERDLNETTEEGLNFIKETSKKSFEEIPFNRIITSFSGLRATGDKGDFVIEEGKTASNFINVACIESPGLTAAPAIAVYVSDMVREKLSNVEENKSFNGRRELKRFIDLSLHEKNQLIKEDFRYSKIVCRCEKITEGEIVDIIHRNAGATTVDGVKRRIRPGMGKCQGGFCMPEVIKILSRELGEDMQDVVKDNLDSKILVERTKE
ncbi:NAD(P)/FAD-dependent oxidoreductase [Hathewaya histolytica]|uniref:Glycerol-3-phosphate dehydrogenase n=1 Tax=Hathewaya histolytica TaxID=1498 RepID=A0A4U9QZ89_HATHI|nr:NAD(P)/FAD-dependent oxidoreductase [Hathewaya histolytica]VTQ83478.1 glycerol-3-phosphate dehydrogenase [Hathewaya histolytica]